MRRALRIFPFFITFFILLCCNTALFDPHDPPSVVLSIFPTDLDFGSEETALEFYIENIGEDTVHWEILEDEVWIDCSVMQGDTLIETTDTVEVTVDRSTLKPYSYSGTIVVSYFEQYACITVFMEIQNNNFIRVFGRVYYVEDSTEKGIQDAEVWITDMDPHYTDQEGYYQINDAPNSGCTINAVKDGFLPNPYSSKILASNDDLEINIELEKIE